MAKKKLAALVGIGILSLSGITYGSYKVYQNVFQWGYSPSYSFEEINTLLLTKQQEAIEKLETSLSQKTQATSSELSRTGSLSFEAKGSTPFGSGSMNISLGNYMSAFQDTSLALWLKDVSFWAEGVIMDQKQSASGSVESFDIKVFQSGSYLQVKDMLLSQHDVFRNLPYEYINVLNTLAASGSYLHIPYDESTFQEFNLQIEEYKDMVLQQRQKQSESLSGALNYIKTRPLFEVSKQEETRYYIVPTKAFCAFIKAGEAKDEESESSFWELLNMLGGNLPMEAANIDFSELKDCDDETYVSFTNNISKNISIYLEKNATEGHLVIELLENEKLSGYIDIYTGISGIEKSIISLSPSQSGSISGSGVYLELEQKMLSGYIDIKSLEAQTSSLRLDFTPNKESKSTEVSMKIHSEKEETVFNGQVLETLKKDDFKPDTRISDIQMNSIISEESFSLDGKYSSHIFSENERFQEKEINFSLKSKYLPNEKTAEFMVSGKQDIYGEEISGNIKWDWKSIKEAGKVNSEINFSLSSSQNISGNISVKIEEDILQNPKSYFNIPENIISMDEFQKKIAVEARKVARMKKIQEAKYLKDLKSGNATLSAYERDGRNIKTTSDIRTLMSAIEIAISEKEIIQQEVIKLSDLIVVKTSKNLENIWTIKVGSINFWKLKQNKSDFWDSYEDEMQIAILETDDWENQFYQLKGNVIGKDNKPTPLIKWNYFKVDTSYPESLFDITQ